MKCLSLCRHHFSSWHWWLLDNTGVISSHCSSLVLIIISPHIEGIKAHILWSIFTTMVPSCSHQVYLVRQFIFINSLRRSLYTLICSISIICLQSGSYSVFWMRWLVYHCMGRWRLNLRFRSQTAIVVATTVVIIVIVRVAVTRHILISLLLLLLLLTTPRDVTL